MREIVLGLNHPAHSSTAHERIHIPDVCTRAGMCTWKPEDQPQVPFLQSHPSWFFETGSLTDLQFADLSRLADQRAPGSPLSLPPKCGVYRHVLLTPSLYVGSGAGTQVNKHSIELTLQPQPPDFTS